MLGTDSGVLLIEDNLFPLHLATPGGKLAACYQSDRPVGDGINSGHINYVLAHIILKLNVEDTLGILYLQMNVSAPHVLML